MKKVTTYFCIIFIIIFFVVCKTYCEERKSSSFDPVIGIIQDNHSKLGIILNDANLTDPQKLSKIQELYKDFGKDINTVIEMSYIIDQIITYRSRSDLIEFLLRRLKGEIE